MGLDWNPGNKPRPGHEEEFLQIYHALDKADEEEERKALLARFEEISISAFETLRTPQVGHDEAATAWARDIYDTKQRDMPFDEWVENIRGFYVLPLVPPCDGLPMYTNGSPGGYVEEYAFRGKFLDDCEEIIGGELLHLAYVSKLPDELLPYGKALIEHAEAFAAARGIDLALLDESPPQDPDSDAFRLHVVMSAGRWCVFWAERGHFLDSYW